MGHYYTGWAHKTHEPLKFHKSPQKKKTTENMNKPNHHDLKHQYVDSMRKNMRLDYAQTASVLTISECVILMHLIKNTVNL